MKHDPQWLVRWKDYPEKDSSWVGKEELQYIALHLLEICMHPIDPIHRNCLELLTAFNQKNSINLENAYSRPESPLQDNGSNRKASIA
jgi:hypothetical protein